MNRLRRDVGSKVGLVRDLNAETFAFNAAESSRLAAYLQLPGPEAIDEVTASVIQQFEDERDGLVFPWVKAMSFGIEDIGSSQIVLEGGHRFESAKWYCRQLMKTDCDYLVISAFTIGKKIDQRVSGYLSEDAVLEAFVLNQWASVLTEQLRSWVTHSLCRWADSMGRTLLPYSGPGYNGWDLSVLHSLRTVLDDDGSEKVSDRIEITEAGMMIPVNSMMLIYAASQKSTVLSIDDSLAQCSRCGMKNCLFRISPPESEEAAHTAGLAGAIAN